jgi:hypothetical protein
VEQTYNRKLSAVTAAFTASDEQPRAELKAVERRSNEHIVALTSAAEIQSAQNVSLAAHLHQAQTELAQRDRNATMQQHENLALEIQEDQHQKKIGERTAANLEGCRQIEQRKHEISALDSELASSAQKLEALQTTSKNQIAALIAEKIKSSRLSDNKRKPTKRNKASNQSQYYHR